jgi:hypothetical protein
MNEYQKYLKYESMFVEAQAIGEILKADGLAADLWEMRG